MLRIIMDTNFLLIPAQFKVDIFQEIKRIVNVPYHVYIHESSIDELGKIASGNSKDRVNANIALALIKQKNLKRLHNSFNKKYTDDLLLECVTSKDMVCTQDRELKQRLKKAHKGIKLIILRSKKYLDFE
jgi:rRNA-processing protein FCF1